MLEEYVCEISNADADEFYKKNNHLNFSLKKEENKNEKKEEKEKVYYYIKRYMVSKKFIDKIFFSVCLNIKMICYFDFMSPYYGIMGEVLKIKEVEAYEKDRKFLKHHRVVGEANLRTYLCRLLFLDQTKTFEFM